MKILTRNGEEYTYGWLNKLVRLYTLDDGSKITVKMLADEIGSTGTCARARLKKYTDPKILYRPVRHQVLKDDRFKPRSSNMINPQTWYKDKLVKLMLK